IRGGVTALAAKKRFPVLLDESALEHQEIAVSAGMRCLQLVLKPQDYQRVVDAVLGQLTHSE
ncbi:MAG: YbaK/EbsC family protein, partial [Polyangiaceae bacterium]